MIELKQLFGAYNVCARFTPGFLFVCALFFLKGEQNTLFQQNSVFFTMLVVMLSSIFGFISASSSKMLERFIWSKCENPTIKYFKKEAPKLYEKICQEHGEKEAISHIRAKTRDDAKLFWKNIAYGFFRNSILLSLATLSLSCSSEYFYLNISIILITIAMTKIYSENYTQQALESYKERRITLFS
ncbi:hypothetical protein [Helicobacter pylori]|uniref:hypothetical protein n=1 Tax=Helicobacter pylori TaxID=210 RepID=UPI0005757D33|nr:hypothetical protein [Helicobacter pylori]KHL80864.1 hypothetical protein HPY1786_06910 [Helicobacter pylori]